MIRPQLAFAVLSTVISCAHAPTICGPRREATRCPAPLFDNLGTHHHGIATSVPPSQGRQKLSPPWKQY
jgi:hypothetical protein